MTQIQHEYDTLNEVFGHYSYFTIQNNKDGKKFPIEINKHKQAFSQVKFELFINNLVYSQP